GRLLSKMRRRSRQGLSHAKACDRSRVKPMRIDDGFAAPRFPGEISAHEYAAQAAKAAFEKHFLQNTPRGVSRGLAILLLSVRLFFGRPPCLHSRPQPFTAFFGKRAFWATDVFCGCGGCWLAIQLLQSSNRFVDGSALTL